MTEINNHQSSLYRLGVGLMILNKKDEVFVGRRYNTGANKWQMPQGGIEQYETALEAAMREMQEEIGSNQCTVIAQAAELYSYSIPKSSRNLWPSSTYIGQTQQWFLVRFDGQDRDINLHSGQRPEFVTWRWLPLTELISNTTYLKKKLYIAIMKEFMPYMQNIT